MHGFVQEHCSAGPPPRRKGKADYTVRCTLARLSFVGHSLGGLVVRAALPHLLARGYHKYFHTFLTLSTMHLGLRQSANPLVSAGVWLLRALKGRR